MNLIWSISNQDKIKIDPKWENSQKERAWIFKIYFNNYKWHNLNLPKNSMWVSR